MAEERWHCRKCGTTESSGRVAPEPTPDPLEALATQIMDTANGSALWLERRARILRELQALHAAGVRAGQERMRERAGHEAEAFDVIHGRKVAHGIADAIRALPLEEPG